MIAKVVRNLSNAIGFKTNQKIVVIESDDWGGIRMPSLAVFNTLVAQGLDLTGGDADRYNRNDTLETPEDLAALYETLVRHKGSNAKHPVITAISVVANPDFSKIRESGFENYFYEPFTETYKRYGQSSTIDLVREGIRQQLFIPQFHGREHLNVMHWMRALKRSDHQTRLAFDHECWGFNNAPFNDEKVSYQAAFDLYYPDDLQYQQKVVKDGLNLFRTLFGYKATYFVPPNGPFNNSLEATAAAEGVRYMSAAKVQREPIGYNRTKLNLRYIGKKNKSGQLYITRNCFFEPNQAGRNGMEACLDEIAIAFKWKKPAIISSHRANYIGVLNAGNRHQGLKQLDMLLKQITTRWPEVVFMTSNELGDLMAARNSE